MPKRNEKVSVLTLGCSKNTVDSEKILGMLKANGIESTTDISKASTIIINTCGFIKPAKEESLNVIMQALDLKSQGKVKKVIVNGCFSERYMTELSDQIEGVDHFFGVNSAEQITKALKPDYKKELIGERELLTPKHYAYLKISEGCNHNCSFCAIPLIRGKHISKQTDEILHEAKLMISQGVKEINIIGQDTTYYGIDIHKKSVLADLLKQVSDLDGMKWLRLLYAYPLNFPFEILDVINERENICKYIDMPLQHVSTHLLKSMKRKMDYGQTSDLVDRIRQTINNVAIRSTFITGYPGETEDDVDLLEKFIVEKRLDRVGIFTFSQEENTSSFELGDPIPEELKQERRDRLMKAQMEVSLQRNKNFIGQKLNVLIEGKDEDGNYIGRTQHDAPDVDNAVIISSEKKIKSGSFQIVNITDALEYDLIGKI